MADSETYVPRLKRLFDEEIADKLLKELNLSNKMQIPRLDKVVVNMGVGGAVADSGKLKLAVEELGLITGQKPVVTKAKRSLAGFKIREGMPLGCKVTLRKNRMLEFIDRVINIALPRGRDFSGLSPKSFDGRGNYSFGINEHLVFSEIDYDKVVENRGMDITVCTTANSDEYAFELLKALNFPFFKNRR